MKFVSNVSGHWTDEQLIASLYGIGPENNHLNECVQCRERLSVLSANRQALEREGDSDREVSFAFLAAQRRKIYARLSEPARPWQRLSVWRWASAAMTVLVLGSGFAMFEQHQHESAKSQISDAQLAQEMSRMSQDLEAQPTAPLQGLFE
jgi:anti-sigma-K factor RskA